MKRTRVGAVSTLALLVASMGRVWSPPSRNLKGFAKAKKDHHPSKGEACRWLLPPACLVGTSYSSRDCTSLCYVFSSVFIVVATPFCQTETFRRSGNTFSVCIAVRIGQASSRHDSMSPPPNPNPQNQECMAGEIHVAQAIHRVGRARARPL